MNTIADPDRPLQPGTMVLEMATSRGAAGRALVFAAAVALVVGGCIAALARFSPGAVAAIVAGVAIYAWLMCSEPQVAYVEYFRLDASGVSFVHTPGQRGRVSRHAWSQIMQVSIGAGASGQESPGLVLSLRPGAAIRGEVVLPILGDAERLRARDLARAWLASRA